MTNNNDILKIPVQQEIFHVTSRVGSMIRMFFKEGLVIRPGDVIEFGVNDTQITFYKCDASIIADEWLNYPEDII